MVQNGQETKIENNQRKKGESYVQKKFGNFRLGHICLSTYSS
jgi:hypothetical protein